MIVRGITPDGQPVYLELEIHGLSRRLVMHVQHGGHWIAIGLNAPEARALGAVVAQHVTELERWAASPTSRQDARVALSGIAEPPRRPVLPSESEPPRKALFASRDEARRVSEFLEGQLLPELRPLSEAREDKPPIACAACGEELVPVLGLQCVVCQTLTSIRPRRNAGKPGG